MDDGTVSEGSGVTRPLQKWAKGPVRREVGDTVYLSVVFSWDMDRAAHMALADLNLGKRVVAGGPALFLGDLREAMQQPLSHELFDMVEIGGVWDFPDACALHNPMAVNASYGCPTGCWWCIVPAMHGKRFTLAPEFTPRPILCDNNLSALPVEYQEYIVEKYLDFDVPLIDANSGFEARYFDEETFHRWRRINRGPWRFAFDITQRRADVERMAKLLKEVPARKKQVYVMIGHEPIAECMDRILSVIGWGCEPHVQPIMKLNALRKRPWVRHDWTERELSGVARWANRHYWRYTDYAGYRRSMPKRKPNSGQGELSLAALARAQFEDQVIEVAA